MPKYEAMVIINPQLDEEAYQIEMQRIQDSLVNNGGEIVNTDLWGKRRLAYPINKQNEGYYGVIDFIGEGSLVKQLERNLKFSENVLRHMIINLDAEE